MKRLLLWRLTAPIIGVSLVLLCVGVGAAWYVHRLSTDIARQLSQYISGVAVVQTLVFDIRDTRANLRAYAGTGDEKHLDTIPEMFQKIGRDLDEAEPLVATERGRELMVSLRAGVAGVQARYRPMIVPGNFATREEFRVLANEYIDPILLEPAREYLDIKQSHLERASEHDQRVTRLTGIGLILLGLSGATAGLLSGFVLARGISRSIFQLSVPISSAVGQLDELVGPVTMTTRWSLEEMQDVLERMGGQITTVIERLQRSHRQALKAERLAAVGQLAAGMAHELRNPLMAIKILVQSASDGTGRLEGRDLTVLEEEITRLEELFQTFLDFARPPQLESQVIDVRTVIEQALGLFILRAERKDVQIKSELPSFPMFVKADAPQLRQVLLNLVLNALDAVEPGGTIWITAKPVEAPSQAMDAALLPDDAQTVSAPNGAAAKSSHFAVEVADDGCGLPPGAADEIFEPFVSTKETGTGLGLSICKQIIEAHGGSISAVNRREGGAVFSCILPSAVDAPLTSEAAS